MITHDAEALSLAAARPVMFIFGASPSAMSRATPRSSFSTIQHAAGDALAAVGQAG